MITLGGVLLLIVAVAAIHGYRSGWGMLAEGGFAPFAAFLIIVLVLAVGGLLKPG